MDFARRALRRHAQWASTSDVAMEGSGLVIPHDRKGTIKKGIDKTKTGFGAHGP